MSEPKNDGTLICGKSWESLGSEDVLSKRLGAVRAEKPMFLVTPTALWQAPLANIMSGRISSIVGHGRGQFHRLSCSSLPQDRFPATIHNRPGYSVPAKDYHR